MRFCKFYLRPLDAAQSFADILPSTYEDDEDGEGAVPLIVTAFRSLTSIPRGCEWLLRTATICGADEEKSKERNAKVRAIYHGAVEYAFSQMKEKESDDTSSNDDDMIVYSMQFGKKRARDATRVPFIPTFAFSTLTDYQQRVLIAIVEQPLMWNEESEYELAQYEQPAPRFLRRRGLPTHRDDLKQWINASA